MMAKSKKYRELRNILRKTYFSIGLKAIIWEKKITHGYRIGLLRPNFDNKYEVYIRNMSQANRFCSICLLDENGQIALKYYDTNIVQDILEELKNFVMIHSIHSN